MFSVQTSVSGSNARIAKFLTANKTVTTPHYVLNAVRGSPPHLTPDLLAQVQDLRLFNVAVGDVISLIPALKSYSAMFEQDGESTGAYHKMIQLPKDASFIVSLRNPITDIGHLAQNANGTPANTFSCPSTASGKFVNVASDKGNYKLTPSEYLEHIKVLQPEIISLLCEECPADGTSSRVEKGMRRNVEWLDACMEVYDSVFVDNKTPVFYPVEGGSFSDKRGRHARLMSAKGTENWRDLILPEDADPKQIQAYKDRLLSEGKRISKAADGFVIGGLGSAKDLDQMVDMSTSSIKFLPENHPRLANIIGCPAEVVSLTVSGLDLFNTSYPILLTDSGYAMSIPISDEEIDTVLQNKSKNIKMGQDEEEPVETAASTLSAFKDHLELDYEYMNLRNIKYREDPRPLVDGCTCYACTYHTRAYISHLLNAHEMLAEVLLMMHNTHQYGSLFAQMRNKIEEGADALNTYVEKTKLIYTHHSSQLDMSGRKKVKPRDIRGVDEE